NIGLLIAGRVVLGVAAAGMVPSSIALLAVRYSNPADRARGIGSWAALSSVGLFAGPLLGGALVTAAGWRLIFLVTPAFAGVSLLLMHGLPNVRSASIRPLDRPGIAASILALGSLTYAFIDGGTNGWARVGPPVAAVVGVTALVALIRVEHRVEYPV